MPRRNISLVVLLLAAAGAVGVTLKGEAPEPPPDPALVQRDQLTYFYRTDCDQCAGAAVYIDAYAARNPRLRVVRYEMGGARVRDIRRAYDAVYHVPAHKRLGVPSAFIGDRAYLGLADIQRMLAGMEPARQGPPSLADRVQDALHVYGANVLRGLLIAALLIAAAVASTRSARGRRGVRVGVRALLAAVLLMSAVTHLTRFGAVVDLLRHQWAAVGPLTSAVPVGLVALIAVELGVAALLIAGRPRLLAPMASLALFGGFLAYVLVARLAGVAGDCGCFPWSEELTWGTAGRNFGFLSASYLLMAWRFA